MIAKTRAMKAQETGGGNARGQETQPGQERLHQRDADDATRHVAYGAAGQLQHFLTALIEESTQDHPERVGQTRSGRVEKSGNNDGCHELQETNNDGPGDVEELAAEGFECRQHLE